MAGSDLETGNAHTFPSATSLRMDIISGVDDKFYLTYWISSTAIGIKQWDGTQWADYTTVTAADLGADRFRSYDPAIGPDGQLHMGFSSAFGLGSPPDATSIVYGKYDGDTWTFSTVEPTTDLSTGTVFNPPRIAIDDEGNAHLAYAYTIANVPALKYASNLSGTWETTHLLTAASPEDEMSRPSIKVGSDGTATIVYELSDNLYYLEGSETEWEDPVDISPPIPDGAEGGPYPGWFGDPLVGSDGTIHMWYQKNLRDSSYHFVSTTIYGLTYQDGSWIAEAVLSSSNYFLEPLDLYEVDGTQYLVIQRYEAGYVGVDLQLYVRPENGSWQLGNDVGLTGELPAAELAVNPQGDLMIVALDEAMTNIVYASGVPLGIPNAKPIVEPSLGESAFIEGAPVVVDADIDVSDADNATLASATISISSGFQEGDLLSAGGSFGNIVADYDPVTGVLSLTSAGNTATVAQWQDMLRSITFEHSTDAPAADDRIITFQVYDGAKTSVAATKTVTVTGVNDDPTGSVTITGTPQQGETLSAETGSLADPDGLGVFSYQWFADGVEIVGATQATYVLTQAEVGKPITVRVAYTDGYDTDESVVSAPTSSVENVNDMPQGTVVITGEVDQGETLSADISGLSDPDGLLSVTYQWQADGVDIPGATGANYLLTQAEVGKGVSVVVRYTDGGGYAESVASTITAPIRNVNDAPTLAGLPGQPVHIPTFPSAQLPDIVIEDIDGADEILALTLVATNARLSDLDDIDPVEPGIQIRGTAAELNSLLAQASLRPIGKGDAALDLTLTDADSASDSATIAYVVHSLPPTPPAEPDLIDGVAVTVRTVNEPGSGVLRETTIPIVTESRQDTIDDSPLADIPLVTGSQDTDLLAVKVPVGFGITARGAGAPLPASSSLDGLIAAIRAHTEAGSDVQETMLGGGTGFLQSLDPADELLVYRLTLTAPGDAPPAQPLVISGAPTSIDAVKAALVIDASQLPAGSVIHLENVAFAVVIGAVDVAGGSGAQIVYADDSAQSLVLGEGDDILYAGGGDDTVGSAEGDDRIFGNAGDDVLFGGPGQDLLHGGNGNDTALFDADIARYAITRDHAITVVQSLDDPSDVDTLVNIETLQFADGIIDVEHDDILGTLAGLYQQVLHRQADLGGIQYWAEAHAAGMSLGDIALSFVWSDEALAQPGTADPIARAATVEVLYEQLLDRQPDEEGQAYWVDRLADGMTLSDVAMSILLSDEMQAVLPAPSDWEFFV